MTIGSSTAALCPECFKPVRMTKAGVPYRHDCTPAGDITDVDGQVADVEEATELDPPSLAAVGRYCSVPNCGRRPARRNLCVGHFNQAELGLLKGV